jgi:hypothetical protein
MFIRSIAAVAASFMILLPEIVAAESTRMFFHDAPVNLRGFENTTRPILFTDSDEFRNQSEVTTAKVIILNTTTSARRVECQLHDLGVSRDFADVTLSPGQFGTVTMMVAADTKPSNDIRLYCYTVGADSGASAQFAKMTIRFGAPDVDVVGE